MGIQSFKWIFIAARTIKFSVLLFLMQWFVFLLIYIVGIIFTPHGLINQMVATLPLALTLVMTVSGVCILFYLILIVPGIYMYFSAKKESLVWSMYALEKAKFKGSIYNKESTLEGTEVLLSKMAKIKKKKRDLYLFSLFNGVIFSLSLLVFSI